MSRFEERSRFRPVRVAYNQWTQFEDFPKFMEGVDAGEAARRSDAGVDREGRRQGEGVGGRDHRSDA